MKNHKANQNHNKATRRSTGPRILSHKLPVCEATGLDRYRDRHQAKAGARAVCNGETRQRASSYACPDCRGFHLEVRWASQRRPVQMDAVRRETEPRKLVLVDIENVTEGARASCAELSRYWKQLRHATLRLTADDHVVVGAALGVASRYRDVVTGSNVKWVLGANAPDAADYALLAAVNLFDAAKKYDELVIVSGDHVFAELAKKACALGLRVRVVTNRPAGQRSPLSRELREAADSCTSTSFGFRWRDDSRHQRSVSDLGRVAGLPRAA